ncbi:galactosyltransferase-related protein [Microbacterium sp. NPDC096154]|uniref:glycosyltransferase family 2 protein n=1 Tax=Microbacterium sp. NPDC096154 TaxID=3155549 RepID=UPI0033268CEB
MRTALITIAHGRHEHWRMQRAALARHASTADRHVLVAIADPHLEEDAGIPGLHVVPLSGDPTRLPLAQARNRGAAAALADGAELLVFLDVDCLPGPELVDGYRAAAAQSRGHLLCGPVTYLDPPGPGGYDLDALPDLDRPHAARPAPEPGEVVAGGPHELFWSLSFALDADTWRRIGGFDEAYAGYGGEDTDFGQRARRAGVDLAWVGSARAYHQHHPVESPPVRHIDDILRNGRLFAERWGWWPMTGWLDAFTDLGLVERDPVRGYRRVRREHA